MDDDEVVTEVADGEELPGDVGDGETTGLDDVDDGADAVELGAGLAFSPEQAASDGAVTANARTATARRKTDALDMPEV